MAMVVVISKVVGLFFVALCAGTMAVCAIKISRGDESQYIGLAMNALAVAVNASNVIWLTGKRQRTSG